MVDESVFYCTKCGKKNIPILRTKRKREAGHLKRLWCLNCKEEINSVEVKPYTHYDYDDFLLEFKYGNFDENGNRKIAYGLFKDNLQKRGIIE